MKKVMTIFLCFCQPSWGSLTLLHHAVGDNKNSQTTQQTTITATTTGSLIVVGATSGGGTHTIASVTDSKSQVYTQAVNAQGTDATDTATTDVWYFLSTQGGVTSVTATYNGTADTHDKQVEVWEISGFASAHFDLASHVNNGSASSSVCTGASINSTGASGVCVGNLIVDNGTVSANPQAGNSFTSGGDTSSDASGGYVSKITLAAAAQQPVWTDSLASDDFASSTACFKDLGGCASPFCGLLGQ